MKLEIGKFYKIVVEVNGRTLTYSCKILSNDNKFISFEDKFGKVLNYNLNAIFSFEKINKEALHD